MQLASNKSLKFSELNPPAVNSLLVRNNNPYPILLQEGQIIEGLRQTRMVAADVLIAANGNMRLSVVCVEQGRWGDEIAGELIYRAPVSVLAALRDESGASKATVSSQQKRVWSSVSFHQTRSASMATTSLAHMTRSYTSKKVYTSAFESESYQLEKDQCGLVIGVQGQPLLMEFFGSPQMLKEQVDTIIQSVLWDLDNFEATTTEDKSLFAFLEKSMGQIGLGNYSIPSQFKNGFSFSITTEEESPVLLHALAMNHNNPIFV